MNINPKVSVITVSYNSEETIADTIKSVIEQKYNNIEYIVIDGGSTDNTVSIITSFYSGVTYFISEPDQGIYDAMNKGVKCSTGDIVGILNSDDFFDNPSIISDVVKHFHSNPTASLVIGDVVYVDPNNTEKITRFYSSRNFKSYKLRFGWMPPHAATFIKQGVYNKFGNYSTDYEISADYDLFVRLMLLHKVCYSRLDKVLVRMRTGGVSSSGIKSKLLLNIEIVKACKNNGIYTNIFLVLLKIPMKLLELFRRPSNNKV